MVPIIIQYTHRNYARYRVRELGKHYFRGRTGCSRKRRVPIQTRTCHRPQSIWSQSSSLRPRRTVLVRGVVEIHKVWACGNNMVLTRECYCVGLTAFSSSICIGVRYIKHGQAVAEPVESAVLQCELHMPAAWAALSQPTHVSYGFVTLSSMR